MAINRKIISIRTLFLTLRKFETNVSGSFFYTRLLNLPVVKCMYKMPHQILAKLELNDRIGNSGKRLGTTVARKRLRTMANVYGRLYVVRAWCERGFTCSATLTYAQTLPITLYKAVDYS